MPKKPLGTQKRPTERPKKSRTEMSTLKADIVEASTTDGNVTIRGNGSGTVAISDNTSITGTFTASGIQTLAAAIAGADNQVGRINLIDYGEVTTAGLDILVFITTDGGTIWHGMVASADSKTPS